MGEEEAERRVCEHVDEEGRWKMESLRELLPMEIVNKTLGHQCPREVLGNDVISWKGSNDGGFNTKSAYMQLERNYWDEKEKLWKDIWR